MDLRTWFLAELEAEARRTRRALEQYAEGKDDWKPHEKSMPFGRLTRLVAMMPSWIAMVVQKDSLDLQPPGGSNFQPKELKTAADLIQSMEEGVSESRKALKATTEEHLQKPWQLMVAGKVVSEDTRAAVLRDTFLHLAHHRGQLTVYLRLVGATVPAIYGPSADDARFD